MIISISFRFPLSTLESRMGKGKLIIEYVVIYEFYLLSFHHMNMLHCNFCFLVHTLFHFTGKYNRHAMKTMLTEDSIQLLLHGAVNLFPLVQVSSLNQVNSLNSSSIRFLTSISDGIHKHELLLPTIYSSLVETRQLKEGSIIKVTKCTCNIVHSVTYV